MILDFIIATLAFLFARAIWDFTKRHARAMKISPLNWLMRVTFYLTILGAIACVFLFTVIYLVSR